MRNITYHISVLLFVSFFVSCDLEKEIDVDVNHESSLIIQGYVENDQPVKLTIQRTSSIEDQIGLNTINDFVLDADVKIVTLGDTTDLDAGFVTDVNTGFTYTYTSIDTLTVEEGQVVYLIVETADGQRFTSSTKGLSTIQLDSIIVGYRSDEDKSNYVTYLTNGPEKGEWFRSTIVLRKGRFADKEDDGLIDDGWFDDDILDEGAFPFQITLFEFEINDTIINITSRLTDEHERYLTSTNESRDANGNPFGQPGTIISNIQGENVSGIFTSLSYIRDTIIFQNRDTVIRF